MSDPIATDGDEAEEMPAQDQPSNDDTPEDDTDGHRFIASDRALKFDVRPLG